MGQAWGSGAGLKSGLGVGWGPGGHHSASEQALQPATCGAQLATCAREMHSTSRQGRSPEQLSPGERVLRETPCMLAGWPKARAQGGGSLGLPPTPPGRLGRALTLRGAAGVPRLHRRSAARARLSGRRAERTGGPAVGARGLPYARLQTEGGVNNRALLAPPDGTGAPGSPRRRAPITWSPCTALRIPGVALPAQPSLRCTVGGVWVPVLPPTPAQATGRPVASSRLRTPHAATQGRSSGPHGVRARRRPSNLPPPGRAALTEHRPCLKSPVS